MLANRMRIGSNIKKLIRVEEAFATDMGGIYAAEQGEYAFLIREASYPRLKIYSTKNDNFVLAKTPILPNHVHKIETSVRTVYGNSSHRYPNLFCYLSNGKSLRVYYHHNSSTTYASYLPLPTALEKMVIKKTDDTLTAIGNEASLTAYSTYRFEIEDGTIYFYFNDTLRYSESIGKGVYIVGLGYKLIECWYNVNIVGHIDWYAYEYYG